MPSLHLITPQLRRHEKSCKELLMNSFVGGFYVVVKLSRAKKNACGGNIQRAFRRRWIEGN